jgi:hypothetical protein
VPEHPDDDGAALSREARRFWREQWQGRSLMVVGQQDPVLGEPVMRACAAHPRLPEPHGCCPRPVISCRNMASPLPTRPAGTFLPDRSTTLS